MRLNGNWLFLNNWTREHLFYELVSFVDDKLNWENGEIYLDLILSFLTIDSEHDYPTRTCPWTEDPDEVKNRKHDHLFKLLFVGDSGVGKSSLLLRMTRDSFTDAFISTIGIDFHIETFYTTDGETIKVQLWDTAGPERFRTVTRAYYRGTHGILLVYDITAASSFERLQDWMRMIQESAQESVKIFLIGNKSDKAETHREVSTQDGEAFARKYGCQFAELSAKTGEGTERGLGLLIDSVLNQVRQKMFQDPARQP